MANKTREDDINTLSYVISQVDVCISFVKNLDLDKLLDKIGH